MRIFGHYHNVQNGCFIKEMVENLRKGEFVENRDLKVCFCPTNYLYNCHLAPNYVHGILSAVLYGMHSSNGRHYHQKERNQFGKDNQSVGNNGAGRNERYGRRIRYGMQTRPSVLPNQNNHITRIINLF